MEFFNLLNLLADAALLVDLKQGIVCGANSAVLKLTAYTSNEIVGLPVTSVLLKGIPPDQEGSELLVRRDRTICDIHSQTFPLDQSGQWVLVKIFPTEDALITEGAFIETVLQGLVKFSRLSDAASLEECFQMAVRITHELIPCEYICIYQAKGSFPEMQKTAAIEVQPVFPPSLPYDDMLRLNETVTWYSGKRVQTQLHRAARLANVHTVISVPLGQKEAVTGLLVFGFQDREGTDQLTRGVNIIAAQIGLAVQQYILVQNLRQECAILDDLCLIRNTAVDNTPVGIIQTNPEGIIEEMNPAGELMLGYTNMEVTRQSVENILIGTEGLALALQTAAKGFTTLNVPNSSLHRRNGQAFPARIQVIPVIKDGILTAILIFILDVSENEQFRVRTQQLEQRAFLGDISAVFAHEVRNPINNIQASLLYLSSTLSPNDPKQDFISRAQTDCARLTHLMDSILALARPMDPRLESMDLVGFLNRLVDRWRPRMTRANITCYYQPIENCPNIRGDARTLDQVFTNLISNAVEAMTPQGSGTLAIKVCLYNSLPNKPMIEVSVSDNGPGIPDEVRAKLFEPFVTTKKDGTGLGLPISKQIITAHRGSISVDTFPGGSIFHVYLPIYNGE